MKASILLTWAIAAVSVCTAARGNPITFDTLADSLTTVRTEVPSASSSSGFAAVRPGAYNSLSIQSAGVVVTITREGGKRFDLVDNDPASPPSDNVNLVSQQGKSAAFGKRSLDPFFDTSNAGFIFTFDTPIIAFSLLAGDFGFDADQLEMVAMSGPDGTGNVVDSDLDFIPQKQLPNGTFYKEWDERRFDVAVANPTDPGFYSVIFRGGINDLSVFVDRIAWNVGGSTDFDDDELNDPDNGGSGAVALIPEPASALFAALGLGWFLATPRRRRR